MAVIPPPVIEQRLSALTPRVRALRVTGGLFRLILATLGALGVIVLLDASFDLPQWTRGLFFSVWITGTGVLAWRWVLMPWRAEITLAEVAHELEKRLPELGERLRSVVTQGESDASSAVRAAVAEDAARRAKTVDFSAAIPLKPAAWLAGGAAAVLLGAGALAAVIPGSAERLRRVALPWAHANGTPAFHVHVTTGELVIKRGGSVTLSAYLKRNGSAAVAPQEAFLLSRPRCDAPETRQPMRADGDGAEFHITLPKVESDFDYCIEIGGARSDWFHVTAVDAAELAEGTTAEITPPAYAKWPKRALAGFTGIEGLQHSAVEFRFQFTRPPSSAHLDWSSNGAAASEIIPLALSADQLSASAAFRLRQDGVLKLVVVSEAGGKKLRAELPVAVRAEPDAPPRFEQLAGVTTRPRTARPNDSLRIAFTARDDTAVATAVLEYALNSFDSKSVAVPIPLAATGSPQLVTGELDFPLAGKWAGGNAIRFRIRITDNRNLGDPPLSPQEAVYPPAGWSEVRLDPSAPPLDQQEVVCRRDTIRERLAAAGAIVGEAATEVQALQADTTGRSSLAVDHAVRLNNVREKVRNAASLLTDLARETALTLELRLLAGGMRAVAGRSLTRAEKALHSAEDDDAAARKEALAAALRHLQDAGRKLSELQVRNAQFAQNRLDALKLASLAADQSALAGAKIEGSELLKKQRALLAELDALIAQSDPLRAAVEAARGAEVRWLAQRTRELADTLRALDGLATKTAAETRASLIATVQRNQDALTRRTALLFGKLETPGRLAGVTLPRPEDFLRVAELAAAGKTVEALTELEKHSQALDRIAATFENWSTERVDPKAAARQLALWQEDLLSRYRSATKGTAFMHLPAEVKSAFRAEQKALAVAVDALPIPPLEPVKAARADAGLHARRAVTLLAANGADAETAMKSAADALNQLAEKTPTIPKRLADALRAFEPLRQEAEASSNSALQALKGNDRPDATAALAKKMAPLAERQRKLVAGVSALDMPGLAGRQARVLAAIGAALRDMQDGSPFDIAASQARMRREFERLKLVLEGNPSPDVTSAVLHNALKALADSLDAHGPKLTAKELEPAGQILLDAQQQLGMLPALETPVLLNEARLAVQGAESALREARPEEVRRRIRAAADALGRLADRLNGAELPLDRVRRLADLRRRGAEKPKELLFSDEAVRQLGREVDDLTFTRVGAAGQALKKRALDLYAKLRARSDPDRLGTDLKALATALDELAAKMADIAELATMTAVPPPAGTQPVADFFLPSKLLADSIRALARDQRELHAQVTAFAAELRQLLRPPQRQTIAALEKQQRSIAADIAALARQALSAAPAGQFAQAATDDLQSARLPSAKVNLEAAAKSLRQLALDGVGKPWGKQAVELFARQDALLRDTSALLGSPGADVAEQIAGAEALAQAAGELVARLKLAAQGLPHGEATGRVILEAAKDVDGARKQISDAWAKAAGGEAGEAEKLRATAEALLRGASEKLSAVAPSGPASAVGEALQRARRLMSKAAEELSSASAPNAARQAMLDAAKALAEAGKKEGK